MTDRLVWLQVIAALAITLLLGAAILYRGLAGPAYLQSGADGAVKTLGSALGMMTVDVPPPDRSAGPEGPPKAAALTQP